jgi:hypothetical protein
MPFHLMLTYLDLHKALKGHVPVTCLFYTTHLTNSIVTFCVRNIVRHCGLKRLVSKQHRGQLCYATFIVFLFCTPVPVLLAPYAKIKQLRVIFQRALAVDSRKEGSLTTFFVQ